MNNERTQRLVDAIRTVVTSSVREVDLKDEIEYLRGRYSVEEFNAICRDFGIEY